MSIDLIWESVQAATREMVGRPEFPRIASVCPYFEGWWHVELAQHFAAPTDDNSGYHLTGFDVHAPSARKEGLYLDLVLDHHSNEKVDELVWVELKQLNLHRQVGSVGLGKLRGSLRRICSDYRDAWACVRAIDMHKTAKRWQGWRDLQSLTIKPRYLQDPKGAFQNVSHVAAAFLLAVVPQAWEQEFWKELSGALSLPLGAPSYPQPRKGKYHVRLLDGSDTAVHLLGLLESFNWSEKYDGSAEPRPSPASGRGDELSFMQPGRAQPGPTPVGGRWDEASFMQAIEAQSPAEAVAAKRVLEWAREKGLPIRWGKGEKDGTFFVALKDQPGYTLVGLYTYGYVQLNLANIRNFAPFDDRETREAWLRRVGAIPGVNLPVGQVDKYPGFQLSGLTDEAGLRQFLAAADALVDEIRAQQPHGEEWR